MDGQNRSGRPKEIISDIQYHEGYFNEKVRMTIRGIDTKTRILHLTDVWSRLTISMRFSEERHQEIADLICKPWVAEFGAPDTLTHGGEMTM